MIEKKHWYIPLFWFLYALASVWLALFISLKACQQLDYGYAFFYDALDIDVHIQTYAAQHPYKRGFEQLPKEQHIRAFVQIAEAVHNQGAGLEAIDYTAPDRKATRLLDKAEVTHLKDVAFLIEKVSFISLLMFAIWIMSAVILNVTGMPAIQLRLITIALIVSLLAGMLAWFGPKAVFYQLHIWIFPAENQWFFYWDRSLMSALMKAPDLFGGIAVMMGLISIPLIVVLYRVGILFGAALGDLYINVRKTEAE